MKVVIPSTAIKGFVNIWFKRVPVKNDPIVVYKIDEAQSHIALIYKQYVYGAGNSKGVTEHYLLKVPCKHMEKFVLTPGDTIEIMTESQSGKLMPFDNEIIQIR